MKYGITVIMSSYNQSEFIEKAINSVLKQRVNCYFQLIITDDCSIDDSLNIIHKYKKQNSEFIQILTSKSNCGYLSNILKAMQLLETEYFCLLDADDYWIDNLFLQKAVDFLDAHKDFTIYSSNCMMLYEDKAEKPFIENTIKEAVFNFNDLLKNKAIVTQTAGTVFRNAVYNKGIPKIIKEAINTPSEPSFRDDTSRYIMHLYKGNAFFKNEITAVYRIHHNGIWAKASTFQKLLRSCVQFYDLGCYFNHKFDSYFIITSVYYAKECFEELKKAVDKSEFTQTIMQSDVEQLFSIIIEDEKYFNKTVKGNDKFYIKKTLTVRKVIKCLLPYGFVRLIQKIRR